MTDTREPHASAAAAIATGEAVAEVTSTVEEMGAAIRSATRTGAALVAKAVPAAAPVAAATDGITRIIDVNAGAQHAAVRGTGRLVGQAAAMGLRLWTKPPVVDGSPRAEVTVAGLGAAFGDHLDSSEATAGLSTPMSVRLDGLLVTPDVAGLQAAWPDARPSIVVFIHGLAATERAWAQSYFDTAERAGFTPVAVRYNTGVAVARNGSNFSALLGEMVANWPTPVERLVIVAHSMGGLVARSAVAQTADAGIEPVDSDAWLPVLTDLVTLGTPHKGSPVERGANLAITGLLRVPVTEPLGRLLNRRSRGIKDLRFGAAHAHDWSGGDPDGVLTDTTAPVPLPVDVRHHAAVATLAEDPDSIKARILGDGLVQPVSASFTPSPAHASLTVIPATGHNTLLNHPDVDALIGSVLTES